MGTSKAYSISTLGMGIGTSTADPLSTLAAPWAALLQNAKPVFPHGEVLPDLPHLEVIITGTWRPGLPHGEVLPVLPHI